MLLIAQLSDVVDCPTYILEVAVLAFCSIVWWCFSCPASCSAWKSRRHSIPKKFHTPSKASVSVRALPNQEPKSLCFLNLPEAVQAVALVQAGPTAWRCVSSCDRKHHQSLWASPVIWKNVLPVLSSKEHVVSTSEENQAGSCRDSVRRLWFGIDKLCVGSFCGQRTAGASQLRTAIRACKGLQRWDGDDLINEVLSRCVKLLRTFDVDDAAGRREAVALGAIIAARTNIFNPCQCNDVEDALNEALQLHELLCEALRARERHLQLADPINHLDDDVPLDVDSLLVHWGDDVRSAYEPNADLCLLDRSNDDTEDDVGDALDKLLSVLHGAISEDLVRRETPRLSSFPRT